jgi:hypothetical protein
MSAACSQSSDKGHWFCPSTVIVGGPGSEKEKQGNPKKAVDLGDIGIENLGDVGYWQSLPSGSGIQEAAWCFDDKDRNNNRIKDKSMNPPSTCSVVLAQNLWVGVLREKDLGRFAIAAMCYGEDIEVSGIPVGKLSALKALSNCQCHNPDAIANLVRDWSEVSQKLKEWGGCQ